MSAGTDERGGGLGVIGSGRVGVAMTKSKLLGVALVGVARLEMFESREGPEGMDSVVAAERAALATSARSSSVFSSMVGEDRGAGVSGESGATKTLRSESSTSMMRMGGGGGGRLGMYDLRLDGNVGSSWELRRDCEGYIRTLSMHGRTK